MHSIRSMFLIGFLIAGLSALLVWYYQKSTTAEDGALALLDRYADAEARVRKLEVALAEARPATK